MIQFPDFQRISFDEANPWLVGAERSQKFAQNSMMFPQDLKSKMLANQIAQIQAQYAQPMAKAELEKSQLFNKNYTPDIQSQIGLRQAEAGKSNKETQWYDREAQARTGLENAQTAGATAEASMNNLKLDYLKSMLHSSSNSNAPINTTGSVASTSSNAGSDNLNQDVLRRTSQPSNSVYGIETPSVTKDDITNKMLLGIDTFAPKMANAQKQQQDQYVQYQKELGETIKEANTAQKVKQALSIFNNGMDNTNLRGHFWGDAPTSGWRTLIHSHQDIANAQIADNASANLLPAAIIELRAAMGQAQFSVFDMKAAGQMKVFRGMDDETRNTQSKWINGVADRLDERAKFYTYMGNPKTGAQKTNADMLWEQYQRDFPLISEDGKTYLGRNEKGTGNLGNWPLYTTPRALASIQATGTYTPSAAEKSTFMMKLPPTKQFPNGRIRPISKGKVEMAFRRGGTPL